MNATNFAFIALCTVTFCVLYCILLVFCYVHILNVFVLVNRPSTPSII